MTFAEIRAPVAVGVAAWLQRAGARDAVICDGVVTVGWDGGRGTDAPVVMVVGGDGALGAAMVARLAAHPAIVVATAPDARRIPGQLSRTGPVERSRLDAASASPQMLGELDGVRAVGGIGQVTDGKVAG